MDIVGTRHWGYVTLSRWEIYLRHCLFRRAVAKTVWRIVDIRHIDASNITSFVLGFLFIRHRYRKVLIIYSVPPHAPHAFATFLLCKPCLRLLMNDTSLFQCWWCRKVILNSFYLLKSINPNEYKVIKHFFRYKAIKARLPAFCSDCSQQTNRMVLIEV